MLTHYHILFFFSDSYTDSSSYVIICLSLFCPYTDSLVYLFLEYKRTYCFSFLPLFIDYNNPSQGGCAAKTSVEYKKGPCPCTRVTNYNEEFTLPFLPHRLRLLSLQLFLCLLCKPLPVNTLIYPLNSLTPSYRLIRCLFQPYVQFPSSFYLQQPC